MSGFDYKNSAEIWLEMKIDETWSPRIQVREKIVEFEKVDRAYGKSINNGRLLEQWHSMSRTGKSKTLNDMTNKNPQTVSIHHTTNTEFFKNKKVELDKHSKQPCFKG